MKFNNHNRYLEFSLLAYGEDKHIFTKYAPNNAWTSYNVLDECIEENEYYESENKKYNTYKILLLISSIIIFAFIIKRTTKKYKEVKSKYTFYKPEIDYEYFRDIPSDLDPIFASELALMDDPFNEDKEKKEECAAILLSLIRKKYIKITKLDKTKDWSKYNTFISVDPIEKDQITRRETLEPLTTSESLYMSLILRHIKSPTNSININRLQRSINADYIYTNNFIENINKKPHIENGVFSGYYQDLYYDVVKNNFEMESKSALNMAFCILIFANVISYFTPLSLAFGAYTILGLAFLWKSLYLHSKSNDVILFTQYGINEQAKWRGLYNFLKSDTLINEKGIPDLVLWEKYLIYATAFGISEKVLKAIKIHAVELNTETSTILNSSSYIRSNTNSFLRTSRSFGHSSIGRGHGGHGGYGGGGRGGRRWRWWSLVSFNMQPTSCML